MKNLITTLSKNQGDVCATLVISGKPKSFDDKEKALVKLRKSIAGAKKIINAGYGEEVAERLTNELNQQLKELDFSKATESLVIYATDGFATAVWLPFAEKERVTILDKFDIQPLIDSLALKRNYWVLALSKNRTRLFRGENEHLNEIIDDNFPQAYAEQFEFDKQHYSLSHKKGSYSPDDSKLTTARFHAFIRHIDHLLLKYLKNDTAPVVLLGVTHNLGEFVKKSSFSKRVVSKVEGNFDHHSAGALAKKVWESSAQSLYGNTGKQGKGPQGKFNTLKNITYA